MNLRPRIFAFFIALQLLLIFNANTETQDKFRIGLLLPLSGAVQEYGQAIKQGQELAIKESPALFKDIKFIYEDSRYDSKTAVTAYFNLINQGADVIYVFGGPMSEVVAPYAQRNKKITFVSGLESKVSINNPYVFRFENSQKEYGRVLAQEVQRRNLKKIAVVLADNQYLNSIYEGFKIASEGDFEIDLFGSLISSNIDFRTLVSKIKSKGFDAVGVFLLPGDLSQFYREMQKQNLILPTLGSDVLESKSEIQNAGPLIEGAFFAYHRISRTFQANYQKAYNQDFQIAFAAMGYDLSNFIAAHFSKHLVESPIDDIPALMKGFGPQVGASGEYSYKETSAGDKYFDFPIVLRFVKAGEISTQQP